MHPAHSRASGPVHDATHGGTPAGRNTGTDNCPYTNTEARPPAIRMGLAEALHTLALPAAAGPAAQMRRALAQQAVDAAPVPYPWWVAGAVAQLERDRVIRGAA